MEYTNGGGAIERIWGCEVFVTKKLAEAHAKEFAKTVYRNYRFWAIVKERIAR